MSKKDRQQALQSFRHARERLGRINRRSFLKTGTLTAFGVAGLGALVESVLTRIEELGATEGVAKKMAASIKQGVLVATAYGDEECSLPE